MARVLARELRPPNGSYDGFDIVREGISWCQTHYEGRTPVPFAPRMSTSTTLYTTRMATRRRRSFTSRIPTAPLTSRSPRRSSPTFSRTPQTITQPRLHACSRRGGRLPATWFLIDPGRPPDPSAALSFSSTAGAALIADPAAPEPAVAYDVSWLRERLAEHGLRLSARVFPGTWSGRPGRSFQDLAVAERSG